MIVILLSVAKQQQSQSSSQYPVSQKRVHFYLLTDCNFFTSYNQEPSAHISGIKNLSTYFNCVAKITYKILCSKYQRCLYNFKITAICTNTCSKSFIPQVNSCVDKVRSVYCTRSESAAISVHRRCGCLVNTFLHGHPYLTVNWVKVWAAQRTKIQQNKVWLLSTQQFDSFTNAMCRCTVLLILTNHSRRILISR